MAVTISLPTFTRKEILTAEKMTTFVTALNNVFSAGFSSDDLAWPLIADGNLDMAQYSILNCKQVMDVVNASEYATFAEAITAAGAGGAVFIPPGYTLTLTSAGLITADNITVFGLGPSSKIAAGAGAAQLLKVDNSGSVINGFRLSNLTIDGNDIAGCVGVLINFAHTVFIDGVHFVDCDGTALEINNNGTDGNASRNVVISNCVFEAGGAGHIVIEDVLNLTISNVISDNATTKAIFCDANTSTAYMYRISIADCIINGADTAIQIDNVTDSGQRYLTISDCVIHDAATAAIIVGSTGNTFKYCDISGCSIYAGTTGIQTSVQFATIANCNIYATDTCIDLLDSADVNVTGNSFASDGTATGVDASASGADIAILNNNVDSSISTAVSRGTTLPEVASNSGDIINTGVQRGYFKDGGSSWQQVGTGSSTHNMIDIPANTLAAGSRLRITLGGNNLQNDANQLGTSTIRFDGKDISVGGTYAGNGPTAVNYCHQVDLVITGSTTAEAMSVQVNDDRNGASYFDGRASMESLTGLTLTAANTLSVNLTLAGGTGTFTAETLLVEYSKVEIL